MATQMKPTKPNVPNQWKKPVAKNKQKPKANKETSAKVKLLQSAFALPKSVEVKVITVRSEFGFSQAELARVTGYSVSSIAGWESGRLLSDSAKQKLVETARLRSALAELVPPNDLGQWMRSPNPAFEGQTPIQVIERGELDRLWQMIFQIRENVAN